MKFPARLKFHDYQYFLDGGTTQFLTSDENQDGHSVLIVQHAFPHSIPSLGGAPGRIYFDGQLIPMRSEHEAKLLTLLRAAEFSYAGPVATEADGYGMAPNAYIVGDDLRRIMESPREQNLPRLLADAIQFVESDDYVRFAEDVEKAADGSRYTAWAAWEPSTRTRTIVRLGSALGIGVPAAREFLARDTPLGENLDALGVATLAERFSREGISLRVEPNYRWRLP